jgi:hypothetical protein
MTPGAFIKIRVRDGSTLHMQVSPTQEPDIWDASAALRRADGTVAGRFDNAALRAGASLLLVGVKPEQYSGPLTVNFAGPSSARVQLSVVKPDGTVQGESYDVVHTGPTADSVAIHLRMA